MGTHWARFTENKACEEEFVGFADSLKSAVVKRESKHTHSYEEMIGEFVELAQEEKKRIKRELKQLGEGHPDALERICIKEYEKIVNAYLPKVNRVIRAKDKDKALKRLKKEMKVLPDPWPTYEDSVREATKTILHMPQEPDQMSNKYVESKFFNSGVFAINDTNMSDAELEKELRISIANSYNTELESQPVEVMPFDKVAGRLIKRVKKIDPDMIILPTRGGIIYASMIPKKYRKKIHVYDISEHNSIEDRMEAMSILMQKAKRKRKLKKVVWLDDEVFTGAQSSQTRELLERVLKEKKFKFHTLVLSSRVNPSETKKSGVKNLFVGVRFKKGERIPMPMLGTKWLRLLYKKAGDRGKFEEQKRIGRVIRSKVIGKGRKRLEKTLSGRV